MSTVLPYCTPPVYQATERIDVVAWADEAAEALHTVSITPSKSATPSKIARGTSIALSIPLDDASPPRSQLLDEERKLPTDPSSAYSRRREPIRRDSLKRREALLKGKEGSRRRQRWENDRLLNNPWAQPPLPTDWEVHPTYPRYEQVPYFLAPLWDASEAARREEEQKRRNRKVGSSPDVAVKVGQVPKELREKLKRTKAAKGLLMDLEKDVRRFVELWEKEQKDLREEGLHDVESEDDELVFVGRNGRMHDTPPSPKPNGKDRELLQKEKLVFDSPVDDRGASFGYTIPHAFRIRHG